MPSRKPVDKEAVLKLYEELQDGRATAQKLGLHENTVYAVLRWYKGNCIRCGRLPAPGRKHCQSCLKQLAESIKERRKERRKNGLCQQCDNFVAPPSQYFCAIHRTERQEISLRYHGKEQEKTWKTYNPARSTKRENHLRYKYGEAGIKVWMAAQDCCSICGIAHKQRSVHIHHIDGDDTNNVETNLVCLCLFCHHTAHRLLKHPQPYRLLAWLRQTYPHLQWEEPSPQAS